MANRKQELIEVQCPCCEGRLWIDPELKAVIRSEEHKRPPSIQDMEEAVKKLRTEESKRDEVFAKSVEQHKAHQDVLSRKFDELFKQAKENPDAPAPKRPFDYD